MMYQKGSFSLYEDELVKVLELPYRDKFLSMLIVLPRKVDGLANVEKELTPAKLTTWQQGKPRSEV